MTILLKHRACTRRAWGMLGAFIGRAQRFTGRAWIMNGLCMGHASGMNKVFTEQSVRGECMGHALGLHALRTGRAWALQKACTGVNRVCTGHSWGMHGDAWGMSY